MSKAVSIARRFISTICMLVLLLPGNNELQAQPAQLAASTPPAGKTYAVVIGISNYRSKGIRKLQFANRDAEEFASYLRSVAVPADNIRLLTDSMATTAAIYDALNWLLETCAENDVVYFYFSGHGDMENTTIYKLGFLLAQNTPRNNFINNALRIEDLNNVANTLSVENKAKVILITDACHSGKLTGAENKGKFLVGDQLRKAQRNEIRITSCAADELSAENEQWGGGRGVFSYYLVNGLKGLAEKQNDGYITLGEIKVFLDSCFAKDAVLAKENHKQTPVVPVTINNASFRLATVIAPLLKTARDQVDADMAMQQENDEAGMSSDDILSLNAVDYFFLKLKEKFRDQHFDFKGLDRLEAAGIPSALIDQIRNDTSFQYMNREKLDELEKVIARDSGELDRFRNQLVVLLHDHVQDIINLYLEGDAAELERRRYYNVKSSGYDIYPPMLSVALKLAGKDNLLRRILEVNMYYLSGLAARIKIPTVKDPQPLIATALSFLEKAYSLEKDAPYILNELGILYRIKQQPAKALVFYKKAADLSSEWALPWANMAGAYKDMKNYTEGFAAAARAKELDPDLQNPYVNTGMLFEAAENYLLAEEEFRKSIQLNTRHYLPFEHLGHVYMNTARYAEADSFFYEADLRKRGFHFFKPTFDADGVIDQMDVEQSPPCPVDLSKIDEKDVLGNLVWGLLLLPHDTVSAEMKFREVIALDGSNPLVFHYLGKILYHQRRWAEADIVFNFAIEYHLDSAAFSNYIDSVIVLFPVYNREHCIVKEVIKNYYKKNEDRFFLASVHETWNHNEEAEQQYKLIISEDEKGIGGYYKLWNLYERTGRYSDAEKVIEHFSEVDSYSGTIELNGFYKRMVQRFPEKAEWFYKAGNFLYNLSMAYPDQYTFDKKYIEADKIEESYSSEDYFVPHQWDSGLRLPGTGESILLYSTIVFPRTDAINYLLMAESMVQEPETLAEINFKIGDLYVWQGLPGRASAHYKRSVDLFPDDANTRIKLLDTYVYGYQFRNALEQLDSLKLRKEINFSKMLQMAEFCAYARRYTDAGSLLKTAEDIYPYEEPVIIDLNGRLKLLEKKPGEAIVFYKIYLSLFPDDAGTMYNLAKLNAQAGNSNEAWKWLQSSLQKGFRYGFVLREDRVWDKLRASSRWQQLLKKYPARGYGEPGSSKF